MLARIAVVLFAVAAAAPANADPASEALLGAFIDNVDASPDWTASAGLIRSEGGRTIGEGLVFSRLEPDVSVSIERLNLDDLRARDGGGFAASSMEMTGGAVISGIIDYAIPSASARDVSAPDMAGISLDPHRMMTSIAQVYSAVASAEFADFRIPEATSTQRQAGTEQGGPATVRATYRDIESNWLRDGVLDRIMSGPTFFVVERPGEGETGFEMRSMTAERLDLGGFARIFDLSHYRNGRGDGIWRPLISRIGYSGISGSGPEKVSFGLEGVVIENVEGRQPEKPFTALWDRLLDPAIPDDAKSDLALETVRETYSSWRAGALRIDGLSLDAPVEQSQFSLGGISAAGLSTEGIESFNLSNLRATTPTGFAALQKLEFAGLVFPDMRATMKFAALETDADAGEHAGTIRSTFAALPRISHVGVKGAAGGESEAKAVTLQDFALDFGDWHNLFARSTDLRIDGLRIPRDLMQLDPKTAEIVDTLGYQEFVLGMSLADRWSPDAGTDDGRWTFTMQNAGDVELAYTLTGVSEDWVLRATAAAGRTEGKEAALNAMLAELGLNGATLKVTDRSLLDRAFGAAAKKQNLTVTGSAYREQLRGALPFLLSAAVPANLTKLLSAPLQAFMAGGQTLIAEIAPLAPIPLTDIVAGMNDPMALPERLGVTLRSEAAPAR